MKIVEFKDNVELPDRNKSKSKFQFDKINIGGCVIIALTENETIKQLVDRARNAALNWMRKHPQYDLFVTKKDADVIVYRYPDHKINVDPRISVYKEKKEED